MHRKTNSDKPSTGKIRFITEYVHWRTKKVMKAADYGYKAWPFGKKR